MKLSEATITIRPRSILELLDGAVYLCGRHVFGLSIVTVLTVLPFAAVNSYLASQAANDNQAFFFDWSLRLMVAPWATAGVTLYLGQVTFERRFSVRRAITTLLGASGSMIIFQVVVRFLCMATLVLIPLIWLSFYFLNEIILLERPPISRAWSRAGAMNRRQQGTVLLLLVIELLVLCACWPVLTSLLIAIDGLWNERPNWGLLEVLTNPDRRLSEILHSWHSSFAFWLVLAFLAVFRFLAYVDSRVRREGWDAELMMRSIARQSLRQESYR